MSSLLFLVIFIVIVVLLLRLVFPPKGKAGEMQVAKILSRLPHDQYMVINDLLVANNGQTTQIDHVVVSEFGIFIIETKFYQGVIYGSSDSEYWTQNIYGNRYKFWNPIFQNEGHVRKLSHILYAVPPHSFVSIVAFSEQATLRVRDSRVMYWHQLGNAIRSHSQKCLSPEQVQQVYKTLLQANIDSEEIRKQHVRTVREKINKHEMAVANGRCPRCGGQLVLRNGKYGDFYGCTNYPHCRFISKI